ncbi:unnamed protein product [Caenorhabditis sp. 36 PRJEB53466]|nr:unnamed protein product [Caenorhabditis sp. 36 PRJEB53466]
MVHVATGALFLLVCSTSPTFGSISTAILKPGDSFLIRDGENAGALARDVKSGHQKMELHGRNKGKWVDEAGKTVDSSNFKLFHNGSVLLVSASAADAGTYQKEPNPIIRIGDMGYAPPILIVQVK